MSDLKPCPFCGGTAEVTQIGTARQSQIIACTNCGCSLETNEHGVGPNCAWNRRAEPMPERDAEVLERQGFKMLIDRDALRDKIIAEAECESVESGVMGLEVQAIQVPPGYALVPVKLTAAMTEAHREVEDGPLRSYQEAWDIVIAAAQEERK